MDFTPFSERSCETLQKLRAKGVPPTGAYIQSLEANCTRKKAPVKKAMDQSKKKKLFIIVGSSAIVLAFGIFLFLKSKK